MLASSRHRPGSPHVKTLAIAAALLAIALPAQGSLNKPKGALFIDFSADLMRPDVTVVFGTLDKLKQGRRRKIKDGDAHLGTGNSVVGISGTQFYRVPVKSKVKVETWLGGQKFGKTLKLAFEIQLARLPNGSYQRQMLTSGRARLAEGMVALWVLAKEKKTFKVLHAIPQPKNMPRRGSTPPARAFEEDMRDYVAINKRIADLRAAVSRAKDRRKAKDEAGARKILKEALDKRLELENDDDRLARQHVGPWERRAKKLLREVGGESKGKDGATSKPTSRRMSKIER